jgi:hypothetical protein
MAEVDCETRETFLSAVRVEMDELLVSSRERSRTKLPLDMIAWLSMGTLIVGLFRNGFVVGEEMIKYYVLNLIRVLEVRRNCNSWDSFNRFLFSVVSI